MSCSLGRTFARILSDHMGCADQWFLDEPLSADGKEIDAREFMLGAPYCGPLPVMVPIGNPGRELAFNFGAFDFPVVSHAVAEIVRGIAPADVEWFPVGVPGAKHSYLILNAVCALDCLDEQSSEFTRWTEQDSRPDRLGQYHVISTIRIDPSRTANHHIFRIKGWPIALLVSCKLKDALTSIPDLGVVFKPVS
jgi:hypothetical protein